MALFRARQAGDALKSRKLLEKKYDEDDEAGVIRCLVDWINATVNGEHPNLEDCAGPSGSGVSWRKLQFHLRDGVVLCKLINILLKSEEKPEIKYNPANTSSGFVALENIKSFNKGVVEYGVEQAATFDSKDLYEVVKGPFVHVISCIKKLAVCANSRNFEPSCEIKSASTTNGNHAEKT